MSKLRLKRRDRGRRGNYSNQLTNSSSSGIGRERANLFAQYGYDLVLAARNEDSLLDIADDYEQQFGIQATVISRSVTGRTSSQS